MAICVMSCTSPSFIIPTPTAATGRYGQTAVFVAAWHGHLAIVRFLLQRGADATRPANGGNLPLQCATCHGHLDVAALLASVPVSTAPELATAHGMCQEAIDVTREAPRTREPGEGQLSSSRVVTVAVPHGIDHPGAGAFYVDNAIPENAIQRLLQLQQTLPMAPETKNSHSSTWLSWAMRVFAFLPKCSVVVRFQCCFSVGMA